MTNRRSEVSGWSYKAYGQFHSFRSRNAMKAHAEEWMLNTEGAEQDRACRVLAGIEAGEHFIDTDKPEKFP